MSTIYLYLIQMLLNFAIDKYFRIRKFMMHFVNENKTSVNITAAELNR